MRRNVIHKNIPDFDGRTIVISDIHGNLDLYEKLLNKIKYKPTKDRLILLGDLVEKGPKSLDTLHKIMEQSKTDHVYTIMGNCDFIARNVLYSYRLEFLAHVLSFRKNSLIHEMAHELNIEIQPNTDMRLLCAQLRKHFLKELSFLNDLPHVLEDSTHIYSHAAIMNERNFGTDFSQVMTTPFFLEKATYFNKQIIVGHLPVTEYCNHIASFDPIYDAKHNVYSIDGGNMVKKGGQLNALLFDGKHCTIERIDDLEEKKVLHDVPYRTQLPFFVTWNHGQVQILERTKKQSYVYCPYLRRSFWVENEFITVSNTETKATDYTNYEIPLRKGDKVKVLFEYQDKVQIKKNGILGWTYRSNLE